MALSSESIKLATAGFIGFVTGAAIFALRRSSSKKTRRSLRRSTTSSSNNEQKITQADTSEYETETDSESESEDDNVDNTSFAELLTEQKMVRIF